MGHKGTRRAGHSEQQETGHQYVLPTPSVRQHPQKRGHDHAGESEEGDEEPYLGAAYVQRPDDLRKSRGDAANGHHRHERDPENYLQVLVAVKWPLVHTTPIAGYESTWALMACHVVLSYTTLTVRSGNSFSSSPWRRSSVSTSSILVRRKQHAFLLAY